MVDYSSRAMTLADLPQIHAIERDIFPFPWTLGNFKDALGAGYDAWVFESSALDQIVGYALLMWVLDEIHLLNLSVAQPFQQKGQGHAFMTQLMQQYGRQGAKKLLLEVRPSNPKALQLYDRCGLIEIGRRKNYYPFWGDSREDAIVMLTHLSEPNVL
jgi:[ribosomal protein S18]-alanine N-acetyltransferase